MRGFDLACLVVAGICGLAALAAARLPSRQAGATVSLPASPEAPAEAA